MKHAAARLFALLFATCMSAHAEEGYPAFSWDRVPVYAHFGYDPALKPEQYDFLAKHFSLVSFAAGSMREEVEKGIAKGAAEIKKRNPSVKVLFYFAGDILHSPFTLSNESFPKDGFIEKPSVRKLTDPKTGRQTEQVRHYFDKSKPVTREWWAGVAEKAVKEYGCDGIFADGLASFGHNLVTPEKEAAIREGIKTMSKLAKEKMGPKGLLIFNPLHGEENSEYLPVTDGAMIDNFDRTMFLKDADKEPGAKDLDMMAGDIEAMIKASKAGKIIIFKAWPGFHQKDKELMKRPHEELMKIAAKNITFPLASFLIAAGPNCYFQYTWGWSSDNGTFDWYPEFDKPLGAPKGDATRDGFKYKREFEHASVFVDLETKTGRIDWK
ncbi:MAG: putative glycoside hydrolase [Verrucomicrobiaceae bacterium]